MLFKKTTPKSDGPVPTFKEYSTDSDNLFSSEYFCCVDDFEKYALKKLPKDLCEYYAGGSTYENTLRENKEAFRRLRILPRVMVNVSKRDTTISILGHKVRTPIGVSPFAIQQGAHPDGELANARAAGAAGTVFILSTLTTYSLEDVAAAAPDTIKWFQLYVYKDRDLTRALVQRAEKAGFKALVLTVDANVFGIRYADKRNNFNLPKHLKFGNFADFDKSQTEKHGDRDDSGLRQYVSKMFDNSISWEDVAWLKRVTKLPIVLKGILTPEDAKLAIKVGASAIMVSNHGGRQLDTSPASIEALPEIAKAVGDKIEIYMDGGVRTGTDVFKALALGAKMAFVARPALWGLTHSGQAGVTKVLDILTDEFSNTLGLAGCNSVSDIKKAMVVHQSYFHKL